MNNLIKQLSYSFAIFLAILISTSSAKAITINPGMFSMFFGDNATGGTGGTSFRAMFGNKYNNDPQLISINLNINEAAGTASVFLSGIHGRIFDDTNFRGDAQALADVTLDLAFTWTGLFRDADGNLVSRTPTGGGAVANLTSSYFTGGSVQFALSPKGSVNSTAWGNLADASNPLYFFLGNAPDSYSTFDGLSFAAWVMANGPVSLNGNSYNVTADFHGQEVPEPMSALLLSSGLLLAPLRRKKSKLA